MSMYRGLFYFSVLFHLSLVSLSQTNVIRNPYLKFDHYTTKEGLSSNYIFDILQDHEGYLWIATRDGLNRFDGYEFEHFKYSEEDSVSLSSSFITSLSEGMDSTLWIGTKNGLNSLDPYSLQFNNYRNKEFEIFDQSDIRETFTDSNDKLWIETSAGQLIYADPSNTIVKRYSHRNPTMTNTYFYHAILKDDQGNIWIGGRYMGIYKFDPVKESFSELLSDQLDPTKKREPDVAVYFIDSRKTFWVGGIDGLYTLNPEDGSFSKVLSVSTFAIAEDKKGQLWIGTGSGLYLWDHRNSLFRLSVHADNNKNSLGNNHISSIYIDRANNVWIGTVDGLSVYRPAKNKFGHIFQIPGDNQTLSSNEITALLEDQKGNLWVGTAEQGIDVFDESFQNKMTFSSVNKAYYKLASDKISVIREDQAGSIWVGQWSGRGMNILSPLEEFNFHFRFLQHELKADWYSDILHDKAGNHWLGLWGAQGLYKYDKSSNRVVDERYAPPLRSAFEPVHKMAFDGRRLWLAYKGQNQFICYDTQTNRFNYFLKDNYNSFSFSAIHNILKLEGTIYFETNDGNYQLSMEPSMKFIKTEKQLPKIIPPELSDAQLSHGNGKLHVNESVKAGDTSWVASYNGLHMTCQGGEQTFSSHFGYESLLSDTIWCLALGDEQLFLGTEKGIAVMKLDDFSITPLSARYNGHLSSRLIKFLMEDREGNIWIGTTNNGLNKYNPLTGEIKNFPHTPDDSVSFWGEQASCAIQDQTGNVWIGGAGLNIYDDGLGEFTHITEVNGLPSENIHALQIDRKGNIWASTGKGLSCIDASTFAIKNYSEKDGLQSDQFTGASCLLKNGKLAFGGKNGINLFSPDEIELNKTRPAVKISSFKIFEELQSTLPQRGKLLKLSHKENYFSFEFTALDYSNPENNLYVYKLDGLDEDWIQTGAKNRVARYTNVDPGNYIFRVKAANCDGFWNEDGTSIPIYISPPWWQTTLFYILLIIALLGIIILLVKYRERKIKEQNQVLLLEQKLLRSQMNPHFIFNSLSSIQSFIFENNPITAGSYLSQFAELIRSILYNSREEFILLHKEITTLKNYLELQQLRYNHSFEFTIDVDPQLDPESCFIPPMLAQPFIENSIEHGIKHINSKGLIKIRFSLDSEFLRLHLEDNGIGIEATKKLKNNKAKEHQSLATIITLERIYVLNKSNRKNKYAVIIEEIKENNAVKGTRVHFTLPLKEDHENY